MKETWKGIFLHSFYNQNIIGKLIFVLLGFLFLIIAIFIQHIRPVFISLGILFLINGLLLSHDYTAVFRNNGYLIMPVSGKDIMKAEIIRSFVFLPIFIIPPVCMYLANLYFPIQNLFFLLILYSVLIPILLALKLFFISLCLSMKTKTIVFTGIILTGLFITGAIIASLPGYSQKLVSSVAQYLYESEKYKTHLLVFTAIVYLVSAVVFFISYKLGDKSFKKAQFKGTTAR
ncbi:hypothetical protein [Treponema phagedenis]|uniref:hypothetical protein n=1 Tax=Treponema phagedenis TaxID=162 RepID=UPI0015826E89|nr:hypothetical protein [Treponema phagedenis]QKS92500.1 hypothetical protein HPJ96_08055 [Treponema phagedenis]